MLTNQDVEQIIDLIREDDRLREQVRRHVLTDELLRLPARFTGLEEKVDGLEEKVDRLDDNLGDLKGVAMEDVVRRDASIVASDMFLTWVRTLERHEVNTIADEASRGGMPAGVSRDDMRSFRRADLVMEIETTTGERAYIAVEVSFQGDERDTTRAIRNARYLARFTGIPAYAAIASVTNDGRIARLVTTDPVALVTPDGDVPVFWPESPPPDRAN